MFMLLAVIGLAFDLGRVYIAHNETQIFADAAAMAAARELDGTDAGIARARAAIHRLPVRWNLGTQPFGQVRCDFSADSRRWETAPRESTQIRFVRVQALDERLPIVFLAAVGGPHEFAAPAAAVASSKPVRLIE